MSVLISAIELAAALKSATPPLVLDVRWLLGAPDGRADYAAGHIPGAVYVDLETELAGHGAPSEGRHPLPTVEALEASARRWGLNAGQQVVAYDANANLASSRVWWLLRWAGLSEVRLLDGGLNAWTTEGFELSAEPVDPTPGTISLTGNHMPVVGLEQVRGFDGVLIDARPAERFLGQVEPVDPKAGHIPGAISLPTADNLTADGYFLPREALESRFRAAGVGGRTAMVSYCGSGVTAAHQIAALEIAGFTAALYPGSWSQWSNHDLPVATL